jgi:hypothetical protein|tara:strand:+ start:64 stop:426 length:363 start_codon:yes stop_codon:yes gene_type:complete
MNFKDIKTRDQLIIALSTVNDFCNPVGIMGVTPLEISLEIWMNELENEGLIDVTSHEPPLVKLNEYGHNKAFRLSLGMLPEFDDKQFQEVIIALCHQRRTNVQRAISKALKETTNGAPSS